MKKYIKICIIMLLVNGCTTMTRYDRQNLEILRRNHITTETPRVDNWEKPVNPGLAGGLNLLPGFGNFYLSSYDGSQIGYGIINMLTWPISIIWSIPQSVIDANRINELDLLNHYRYDNKARENIRRVYD